MDFFCCGFWSYGLSKSLGLRTAFGKVCSKSRLGRRILVESAIGLALICEFESPSVLGLVLAGVFEAALETALEAAYEDALEAA